MDKTENPLGLWRSRCEAIRFPKDVARLAPERRFPHRLPRPFHSGRMAECMTQAIADPHLRAELACCDGQGKLLAAYFRRTQWPPSSEVLKSLSRHLNGSDNWNLRFVVRNGRPPKDRSGELWEEGQERAVADRLYVFGERIANDLVPQSEIQKVQGFLIELANALDPGGNGKWKLAFERPRRGNPSTPLRNTIRMAILGHRALELYSTLKNWRKVDEKLDENKPDATDSKLRKAAVRLVREPRK